MKNPTAHRLTSHNITRSPDKKIERDGEKRECEERQIKLKSQCVKRDGE